MLIDDVLYFKKPYLGTFCFLTLYISASFLLFSEKINVFIQIVILFQVSELFSHHISFFIFAKAFLNTEN